MANARREVLKLTVAEAFPLYPHRTGPNAPHYAPGSEWYYEASDRLYVDQVVANLRGQGFTVTVTSESH